MTCLCQGWEVAKMGLQAQWLSDTGAEITIGSCIRAACCTSRFLALHSPRQEPGLSPARHSLGCTRGENKTFLSEGSQQMLFQGEQNGPQGYKNRMCKEPLGNPVRHYPGPLVGLVPERPWAGWCLSRGTSKMSQLGLRVLLCASHPEVRSTGVSPGSL